MKNKIITLMISILLLATVGCGDGNGKIQVKIGMWPEGTSAVDVNMFNVWKGRFEKDHPEYEIVAERYDYATQTIDAKAMSNTLPTVFQTWFTEPQFLVENRYIRPITAQLKELDWLDKMDDDMRNIFTFDDEIYGVPRDGYGLGLIINLKNAAYYELLPDTDGDEIGEIYDANNNPLYPKTFEDLYQWSLTLAEENTKGTLILSSNKNGGWQFSNIAWNFGGELMKEVDGKYTATLTDPKVVEAMEYIRRLRNEGLLLESKSLMYTDWYTAISDQVVTAIVGNDVLSNAVVLGGLKKEEIAYVPLPKGPYGDQYSLFGGTPYVFAKNATDAQVKGALLFLEYMGRSPEASEVSELAMREGMQVSVTKGTPILPTIKAWKNAEYLELINAIEEEFVNVEMANFNDFFESIDEMKHSEIPYQAQEMYAILDSVIQDVFDEPGTINVATRLATANNEFNNKFSS